MSKSPGSRLSASANCRAFFTAGGATAMRRRPWRKSAMVGVLTSSIGVLALVDSGPVWIT